jgi:hypothetical protein
VRWLLLTMLKPVTLTLAIVLAALNDVKLLLPLCQLSGPAPLKPSHCPLLFVDVDGLLMLADTLAKANAAAPALSPAIMMSSTTVRVATPLLIVV